MGAASNEVVEVPFPVGSPLLVGAGVEGAASDEVCAEMSVAQVRKMLMSSRRIKNDILAVGTTATTNDSNERDRFTGISKDGPDNV